MIKQLVVAILFVLSSINIVAAQQDKIRIAIFGAWSGTMPSYEYIKSYVNLWKYTNPKIKDNVDYEIKYFDDGCNVELTRANIEFIKVWKPNFLIGPTCTATILENVPFLKALNIPIIVTNSSSDDITQQNLDLYRLPPTNKYIMDENLELIKSKGKKIALIYDDTFFGKQHMDDIVNNKLNFIALFEVMHLRSNNEQLIHKLKINDIEAVLYSGYGEGLILLSKLLANTNIKIIYTNAISYTDDVKSIIGEKTKDIIVLSPTYETQREVNALEVIPRQASVYINGIYMYASLDVIKNVVTNISKPTDKDEFNKYIRNNKIKTIIGNIQFTNNGEIANIRDVIKFD